MLAPMTTECGHSFCYECLHQWFQNKINCPTCRHEIQTKPALNMKLNDVSKSLAELIIDARLDPNVDSFRARKKDAMSKYESHAKKKRVFGELFCGYSLALIDDSDGVPRCGNCLWEAHGTVCLHCGSRFRNTDLIRGGGHDDDDDDDEDEEEFYQDVPPAEDHYDSDDSFVDSRTAEELLEEIHDNGPEDNNDDQPNATSSDEDDDDGAASFRNWLSGSQPRLHIIYVDDTDSEFEYNPRIYSDSDEDSPQQIHFGGGPGGHVIIDLDADEDGNDSELIDALADFQHGVSEDEANEDFRSLHEDHENDYYDRSDDDEGGEEDEDGHGSHSDPDPDEYYDDYDAEDHDIDQDDVDVDVDQNEYEDYDDNYNDNDDYDDGQETDGNW